MVGQQKLEKKLVLLLPGDLTSNTNHPTGDDPEDQRRLLLFGPSVVVPSLTLSQHEALCSPSKLSTFTQLEAQDLFLLAVLPCW